MISLKHLKATDSYRISRYAEHAHYITRQGNPVGYYVEMAGGPGRAPSWWHGCGADTLGLEGHVQPDHLARILAAEGFGRRSHPRRRVATDLTISAPKSVSIAALALGDDELLEGMCSAAMAAVDHVERTCVMTRKGKGGRTRSTTGNLIAACFLHEDARPVDGIADPQAHIHVLIGNLTQRPDGGWRAVDLHFGTGNCRWYRADTIFHQKLAETARSLGYGTVETLHGFELAGLPREIRERFSYRRRQVDAALVERGRTRKQSRAGERINACLASRESKTQLSQPEQREEWHRRAVAADLDLESLRGGRVTRTSLRKTTRLATDRSDWRPLLG
ncbi:MobF family relaxase [Halofilum ochraceum]|uniref:MobF family relaxase n=1 Tax=Halofilum ochraceum TaxID=1611323 RepID=UPI0008DA3451|nr:MobF family relaxase [Halofilum ochraceum]